MDNGGPAGFGTRTPLADALEALADTCVPHDRTATVPVADADARVLAAPVTAARAIPHYERATTDGWAVRAANTADAAEGSPIRLEPAEDDVATGTAVRVHAGSAIPAGADAVLGIESVDRRMEGLAVYDAVGAGENVDPVGAEVPAGEVLLEPGRRLVPAVLTRCRATGVTSVEVRERPQVAVLPTGEALVGGDGEPAPGEMVETNGLLVSQYCERWGGDATYRDVVPDDVDELVAALERDADHDLLVTTGGTSVGQRDLVPRAIREAGEMRVHGVDVDPGHPVGIGTIPSLESAADPLSDTPVVTLPGAPASCLINAVQCVRPAVGWLVGSPLPDHPTTSARLARALSSEVGTRSFARVRFVGNDGSAPSGDEGRERAGDNAHDLADDAAHGLVGNADDGLGGNLDDGLAGNVDDGLACNAADDLPRVEAVRTSDGGLSSVAGADGWVEVPESAEGLPADATVTVQHWDRCP